MKIDKIQGVNMELTEAIEGYLDKRIKVLSKLVKRIEPASLSVDVGKPSEHHNKGGVYYAEFTADINGNVFKASENADDLYAAIDKVQASIKRQIVDWKKKDKTRNLKQGRRFKDLFRFGK